MLKLLYAFAALALLTMFPVGSAFAQPSQQCLTKTIFGEPLKRPMCFVPTTLSPLGGGGATVAKRASAPSPADPVDPVDPVDPPTSVPSTPLTPATPNPGVITGTLPDWARDEVGVGSVSGYVVPEDTNLGNGTVIPAGTYSGRVAPDGTFVAKPD